MNIPFSFGSKRATNDIVVELSRNQDPPTLPFDLKNHVSPNTWEVRSSALARLASQYCRPSLERAYLVVILVLTFLVPITTYYIVLQALESTTDNPEQDVWFARFSCFAATVVTWMVLATPLLVWKHIGKVHAMRLTDQWTREDVLMAPTYGGAPVWTASLSGLFRDAVVLRVTIPVTKRSYFDRDSCLPPYVSVNDDGPPPYGDSRMINWSKDSRGGVKFGEIPIYTGEQSSVA